MSQAVTGRRGALKLIVGIAAAGLMSLKPMRAFANYLLPSGDDQYHKFAEPDGSLTYIEAIDITLDQTMLAATALVVRADTLTLAGPLSHPGLDLFLVARVLVAQNGASISTKGAAGQSKAGQPLFDGANGWKDTAAERGANGGNVIIAFGDFQGTLSIDTSGGNGGDAQNGGTGKDPGNGANATIDSPGKVGPDANQGGDPGIPGDGGDSGAVTLWSIKPFDSWLITVLNTPGDAGKPADYGLTGRAGDPGLPGTFIETVTKFCPDPSKAN